MTEMCYVQGHGAWEKVRETCPFPRGTENLEPENASALLYFCCAAHLCRPRGDTEHMGVASACSAGSHRVGAQAAHLADAL